MTLPSLDLPSIRESILKINTLFNYSWYMYEVEREGIGDLIESWCQWFVPEEIPFGWVLMGRNSVGGWGEHAEEESESGDKMTTSYSPGTV